MLTIETSDGRTWFKPGESIQGRASWYLDREADAIEIRLFWYTSGKGTRDVGIEKSLEIDRPDTQGYRDFSFKAPEGPYSFSGKLITLQWSIEVVVPSTGETERVDFTVGPRPVEVVLT
jgi:hypothetical protein